MATVGSIDMRRGLFIIEPEKEQEDSKIFAAKVIDVEKQICVSRFILQAVQKKNLSFTCQLGQCFSLIPLQDQVKNQIDHTLSALIDKINDSLFSSRFAHTSFHFQKICHSAVEFMQKSQDDPEKTPKAKNVGFLFYMQSLEDKPSECLETPTLDSVGSLSFASILERETSNSPIQSQDSDLSSSSSTASMTSEQRASHLRCPSIGSVGSFSFEELFEGKGKSQDSQD